MFTLAASHITLNEPVLLDFSIDNEIAESIHFDLGHNCKSHFEFTITEPSSAVVHPPRLSEEGLGRTGRVSLGPNETYTQTLVVNEWYEFREPGDYTIEAKLASPVLTGSGAVVEPEPSGRLSLHVAPRDAERLRQVCQDLYRRAGETRDVEQKSELALALSYVRDPIAVPFLAEGLYQGQLPWQYVIPGLARIANAEAIDVLIGLLQKNDPEAGSALARFVLEELEAKIQDSALKANITNALQRH